MPKSVSDAQCIGFGTDEFRNWRLALREANLASGADDRVLVSRKTLLAAQTCVEHYIGACVRIGVLPLERVRDDSPGDIRAAGWMVAVHNDYRLHGENHTFWLFTKGDRCVKGEGRTDADALNLVRQALREVKAQEEVHV